MKFLFSTILAIAFCTGIFAQETQVKVVDEVVAQVNEGVITLSRIKREIQMAVDSLVSQGKTREEAQKTVDEKQGDLIANLINEELLMQRAKEAGMEPDIEASLNQQFAEIMRQNNIKTIEALHAAMEKDGIDPAEIRETWRKQATRDRVFNREVAAKVYWEPNGKQLKDYYEKNRDKFKTPETVSFSNLFLSFPGKDPAVVREKAAQLHAQLKAGGDFKKIVAENGEPGPGANTAGETQKLEVNELVPAIAGPLKGLKVGEMTSPIEIPNVGISIIRVEGREAASTEAVFNEEAVRRAILAEREPEAKKKFMAQLRDDSYIKISDTFRPIVSPILYADERKDKAAN